ncbi:MAG: glycosyltransferase family 39 protein [Anaerolineales bacterium]|nr:glycosyltransferase family 39 protein [Anaerolineales bacterium]
MSRDPRPWLALLLILLLAMGLRFYQLDLQSFWSDEGNSAAMIGRTLPDILTRSANDISPPLYYLALSGWGRLTGTSEFSIRAFSALFGVLAVALTAALGRRIGGWPVAIVAAFASATAPYAIYYGQEARMYGPIAALVLVAWLCTLALQRTPTSSRWLLGYGAVALALLHTQYFTAAALVGVNLAWLWQGWRDELRPAPRRWIAAQLAVALLFLPWLSVALRSILGWPAVSAPLSPSELLIELFRLFTVGAANEGIRPLAGWGMGLLLVLGLSVAGRALWQRRAVARAVPLWLVAIPPLLMWLLSLDRPFWNPKFLTIAVAGAHLLIGQGAALIARSIGRWRPAFGAVFVAWTLPFLAWAVAPTVTNGYHDPTYWRDDYRSMVALVDALAAPDDAVILDGAGQAEIWSYYDQRDLAVYPLPAQRPLDVAQTTEQLEQIAAHHPSAWLLWWAEREGDPDGIIPGWLDANGYAANARWYGNVRLQRYHFASPSDTVLVNETLTLPGSDSALTLQSVGMAEAPRPPGALVALEMTWTGVADRPLTFFAQLLDDASQVVGQYDGLGGAPPVDQWRGAQIVRMALPIAVGTPPGPLRLIVGVYDGDGQRLLTAQGRDHLTLATIEVTRPPTPLPVAALALPIPAQRDLRLDDFWGVRFVGAEAYKVGFAHQPATPLAAGDPMQVHLYWQVVREGPALPDFVLVLRDFSGKEATSWPWAPLLSRSTDAEWRAGDLVREGQALFLPADLPEGTYELWLELPPLIDIVLSATDSRLFVGTIEVQQP